MQQDLCCFPCRTANARLGHKAKQPAEKLFGTYGYGRGRQTLKVSRPPFSVVLHFLIEPHTSHLNIHPSANASRQLIAAAGSFITPLQNRSLARSIEAVRHSLEAKPDLYLRKLQAELKAATGTQVARRICGRSSASLAFSAKKPLHATRRDTEANRGRREVLVDQLRRIVPEMVVFLDESGVSTQMTKRFGGVRRGRRVAEVTPKATGGLLPSWAR